MRIIALIAATITLAACGNASMSSTGTGATVTAAPTRSTAATPAAPVSVTRCTAPTPAGSQGSQGIVDRVDFVDVAGATFTTPLGSVPLAHPSGKRDLGAAVATVECQLSDHFSGTAPPAPQPGDAAFLAAGTVLHAAAGFDPACRLLAVDGDGQLHVYLADGPDVTVHTVKPCALDPAVKAN